MMKKILSIDTSNSKQIQVSLTIGKTVYSHSSDATALKSQIVLLLISKILDENKLKPEDLTQIEVNLGPGSFTGIRVGVSVANTLGTFLKIPVNNKKVGDLVEPLYNN